MKVQGMGMLGLFVVVIFILVRAGNAQLNAFLVNCGSNSSVIVNGRKWIGDSSPGNNITLSSHGIEASSATFNGDPVYAPLYKNARLFIDRLNYTFQVPQGRYFLRLHFYPLVFEHYDANVSYFSVSANGLKLISEFNIPGEIIQKNEFLLGGNSSFSSLVKEYIFNVDTNVLVVDFIPSKGTFGLVNAIEVIPVADNLFAESVKKVGGNGANASLDFGKRGLQTVYRLNVGGGRIRPDQDKEFWRLWEVDSGYMINPDAGSEISNQSAIVYASPNDTSVAPLLVYESARTMSNSQVTEKRFNMSWKMEVDPGFDYLVRLHFCELQFNVSSQRNFRIYINNRTAADNVDLFMRAGGKNRAYHEDYFDVTSPATNNLWIQLGPDSSASAAGTDALLSGLEVFKLSRDGNLAYVQRYGNLELKKSSQTLKLWVAIGAGIASIAIAAAIVALMFWLFRKPRAKDAEGKKTSPGWRPLFLHESTANAKGSLRYQNPSALGTSITGRHFTFAEIKAATNNFDESLVIGVGGFGKVYKGELEDSTLAAIKRANPQSQQGLKEFETEIELLSKLRHRHLVAMIGFCDEANEMILVYEFMANGTLRSHLFGSDLPSLTWKQRLEVSIGAARGLHYLHTGSERGIIHRDVKTTNILLDENFVAKMADFGLSKTGPSLEHTHVSTAVKGSFGYLDPEYFRRQQLTEKSDVYSFGVVLFEVLCARAVINPTLPKDQINLAEWAMKNQRQKSLETIIDPRLRGKYSPESIKRYAEIAEKCLADEGKSRPTMGEILWHLEYVLQLQEAWLRENAEEVTITDSHPLTPLNDDESGAQVPTNLETQGDLDAQDKEGESEHVI
ncbi:OLC1v1024212C1 [Oldenlandia corymbosa var. corymbosa]|uniref:OLC1v1024212C1 n=1 Tax=Oldenlandia corymbosa var. corymbosa TaxID=529605 RepID=A0AAV1C440_OLDCO|nr:OLC1v1024212C1 [Oldenlandia corymbosa var. corymbosa]